MQGFLFVFLASHEYFERVMFNKGLIFVHGTVLHDAVCVCVQ